MARILDIDTKYKIVIVSLLVIFIVIVAGTLLGSKISDWFIDKGPVAVIKNEGELVINYLDGEKVSFFDNKEHAFSISLTNTSSSELYYSIYLNDLNGSNIVIVVKDKEDNVIREVVPNSNSERLINLYSVQGGETVRYKIVIEPKEFVTFNGTFKVVNDSLSTSSFDDLILLNNEITSPKTRVGDEISTISEGLISTSDNKGTTYYFRGDIRNNYLKLGDHLFRVVRINGDGTVRVVLDGVIDKQYAYNTNSDEELENLLLFEKSSLVAVLNKWVTDELKEYSSYLVNGDYCTDTNMNYTKNNINYSRAYERIYVDSAPDLYCSGKIYSGKVGLLSIDEVVLAGAYKNQTNENYYLYNKDISGSYLTSSSYYVNDSNIFSMMNVLSNGALGDGTIISTPSYIRPVLNISLEAKVKGEGTINNPYIIVS